MDPSESNYSKNKDSVCGSDLYSWFAGLTEEHGGLFDKSELPPKKMYLIILKKMYIQKFGEEIG
jgi:hypothetical protein